MSRLLALSLRNSNCNWKDSLMVMGQTGSRQAEWSKAAQHKYLSARQSFPRTKEFVQLHPEGLMTDYLQNFLYTHWRLPYALLRSIHSTQKCNPKKLKLFLCLIHLYKITNLEPKAHNVHEGNRNNNLEVTGLSQVRQFWPLIDAFWWWTNL